MAGAFAGERSRDVTLGVPGGHQGQRHHREPVLPRGDEPGDHIGHRRT